MQTPRIAAAVVALAGIGFLGEFAAGAGALWVDFATDLDADGSLEGNAASRLVASSPHVGAAAEDGPLLGQRAGHPAARFGVEFLAREYHRIRGAAGATACAVSHGCSH